MYCMVWLSACGGELTQDHPELEVSSTGAALTGAGVEVHCTARNDFGYVASAHGTMIPGIRAANGEIGMHGSMTMIFGPYGGPMTTRKASVRGQIDPGGTWLTGAPTTGAPEITGFTIVVQPNSPYSAINGANGTNYQTDCAATIVHLPHGSDLILGGELAFTALPDGSLRAVIDVTNVGDQPTPAASGELKIGSFQVAGLLYPQNGAGGSRPLAAMESGYLQVHLPKGALARCHTYPTHIDVTHVMQAGSPDPFLNDVASVSSPCLTWTTPIDLRSLGAKPDASIAYKTIAEIVSSQVTGRADQALCSGCHYQLSSHTYHPDVGVNGSAPIGPRDAISGMTWAQTGGWADQFISYTVPDGMGGVKYFKPAPLRALFTRWKQDGAR